MVINVSIPQGRGRGHLGMTGDAVVDGDDQPGLRFRREVHDLRRQTIAILKAIGHQEVDVLEAEASHLTHHQRRAGSAVGVEISDDHDAGATTKVLAKQIDRGIDTTEVE